MIPQLPTDLYLGMIENEWPIFAMEGSDNVADWLDQGRDRHAWHVSLVGATIQKIQLVKPSPYLENVE